MAATLPDDRRREGEREAWRLRHVARWELARIGEHLGVEASSVNRMLARVEKQLVQEFSEQALALKMEQTLLLRRIYEDAMAAWERSKEEVASVTSGRAEVDRAGRVVALPDEVRRSEQCGNPAFLAQARAAQADIRAIWGLDAPKSVDVTSAGEPVKYYAVAQEVLDAV